MIESDPVIVEFPDEFDITNAGDVAARLREAISPGISAVVADLTATAFCDSSGVRIVVLARDWAITDNVPLRLAVRPGPTLVVLKLVGLDQLLPIYPSLDEALAGEPVLDGPVLDGPVLDGPVLDGSVLDGSVLDGSVLDGDASHG